MAKTNNVNKKTIKGDNWNQKPSSWVRWVSIENLNKSEPSVVNGSSFDALSSLQFFHIFGINVLIDRMNNLRQIFVFKI